MEIRIENKDRILSENCFIKTDNVSVNSWYGLTYFEICDETSNLASDCISVLNRESFFELKACIDKMAEEINRLENL